MTSVQVYPHPSPIALMDVLDIQYTEGGVFQEKSIASFKNNVRRACDVINSARGGTQPAQ
jgi:hypothetical protein